MNEILKSKLDTIFRSILTKSEEGIETKSYAKPGATEFDIRSVDLPVGLPKDYLEFLRYTNGCSLFNYDDLDGFQFFGTHELGKQNDENRKLYENDWDDTVIVFCRILGEGNHIGFKILNKTTHGILDCFHEYLPAEWEVIGKSFDGFLEKLIDLKGRKYWL